MEYKKLIVQSPFNKIQVKFREPVIFSKTIPVQTVECLLKSIYKPTEKRQNSSPTENAFRRMIRKYTNLTAIDLHITPHMFRHTFTASLLEIDVDIHYIQEMLGHSTINITEIYTHVAVSK